MIVGDPLKLRRGNKCECSFCFSDGNSITWYEPLPIQTIQDASRLDHSSYTKLLKRANNASLSWNFSLSSDLIFDSLAFSFEGVAIAGVRSSGRGVLPRFQDKYKISWISFQRFTLVILNVTIKDNGTFSCGVYAAKGVATFRWKSNVQAYVVGKKRTNDSRDAGLFVTFQSLFCFVYKVHLLNHAI